MIPKIYTIELGASSGSESGRLFKAASDLVRTDDKTASGTLGASNQPVRLLPMHLFFQYANNTEDDYNTLLRHS